MNYKLIGKIISEILFGEIPDGYSFDADFELTIGDAYAEWILCIWKD